VCLIPALLVRITFNVTKLHVLLPDVLQALMNHESVQLWLLFYLGTEYDRKHPFTAERYT